jgi:hypothetical protein
MHFYELPIRYNRPPAARITGDTEESRVLCLQKEIEILQSCFRGNDGGRSSMVEPQIVVLVVAGSSPVDHPICEWSGGAMEHWGIVFCPTLHYSDTSTLRCFRACSSTG